MLDYIETAMPGSLLRIADLDSEQLDELLDLAEHIEGEPHKWERKHRGGVLARCFAKPSTRAVIFSRSRRLRLAR